MKDEVVMDCAVYRENVTIQYQSKNRQAVRLTLSMQLLDYSEELNLYAIDSSFNIQLKSSELNQ